MNTEKSSEAVRRARKDLFEKIRNDWDNVLRQALPCLPDSYVPYQWNYAAVQPENMAEQGSADSTRHPFRKNQIETEGVNAAKVIPGFPDAPDTAGGDALDWRERTYAPSDPSSDEDDSSSLNIVGDILDKVGFGLKSEDDVNKGTKQRNKKDNGMENANGTGGQDAADQPTLNIEQEESDSSIDSEDQAFLKSLNKVECRKYLRARRRRKRLEREMRWNNGLRHWGMQRDVWCCAKPRSMPSSSKSSTTEDANCENHLNSREVTQDNTCASLEDNRNNHDSSVPQCMDSDSNHNLAASNDDSKLESHSPIFTNHIKPKHIPSMILPIAPPILPDDDPTRGKISVIAYPSIYSRLVTQSLSPSVPLNLAVVVPALVEGWKENGEWPTGTSADPTIAVDPANGTVEKRLSTNSNSLSSVLSVGAIADATKNGLRALGHRASTSSSTKKSDAKSAMLGRSKKLLWPGTATSHDADNQNANHCP